MSSISSEVPAVTTAASHGRFSADVVSRRLADYLQLTRPRIAVMSAVAVAAGFRVASPMSVDWLTLFAAIIGIVCFVAVSSTWNQVLERRTDSLMNRTESRPFATGRISATEGWVLGFVLCVVGALVLGAVVNTLTLAASALTMLTYVFAYTPLKRTSVLCTTVGAIPGAMPPVLGWLAAGRGLGVEALALFAIFFVWQFPHFLAIGWLHRIDYQRAGLRMLPSFHDNGRLTAVVAITYAIAFVPVSCLPRFVGLAGQGYLFAALVLSAGYLWLTVRFVIQRSDRRARQLMIGSLLCLPVLLLCLVGDFVRLTSF
ncbi:MAG: heme o synthase [Planctomycetaceae bacterium]|nr:heme o synthase [Planctomycetaceae bacterium]